MGKTVPGSFTSSNDIVGKGTVAVLAAFVDIWLGLRICVN
jgi:hypothetical protein